MNTGTFLALVLNVVGLVLSIKEEIKFRLQQLKKLLA